MTTTYATLEAARVAVPDAVLYALQPDGSCIAYRPGDELPDAAPTLADLRAALAAQIDDAVAAIYARYGRFQIEYEEREAQAQAFKSGGYSGTVPARVAEFATPAGLAPQAATDLILAQAAALRTAMGQLSAQRMRKYEVLGAASESAAQSACDAILANIAGVAAALT